MSCHKHAWSVIRTQTRLFFCFVSVIFITYGKVCSEQVYSRRELWFTSMETSTYGYSCECTTCTNGHPWMMTSIESGERRRTSLHWDLDARILFEIPPALTYISDQRLRRTDIPFKIPPALTDISAWRLRLTDTPGQIPPALTYISDQRLLRTDIPFNMPPALKDISVWRLRRTDIPVHIPRALTNGRARRLGRTDIPVNKYHLH